jgi:iron complex outermembrane receptor protein
LGASYTLNAFLLSLFANNIFNTEYTETNLVPMPKGNLLFDITLDRQSQSKPKVPDY